MSQYKGAMVTLLLMFILLVIPSFFIVESALTQFTIMKANSEMGELVKEEGGYTPRVASIIDGYRTIGMNIQLLDKNGNPLTTYAPAGELIKIKYDYSVVGVRGEHSYSHVNEVLIRKRSN